uniref:Uncharacterized protein n=1 Tax=Pipistrellus kuhlii TaxID=59472 RepID=A0A7J7R9J4_PIPKU|nr:hypothetical protein mPipKuh1_010713 [Pipistrellus kuhlii]
MRVGVSSESPPFPYTPPPRCPHAGHVARIKISAPTRPVHSLASPQHPLVRMARAWWLWSRLPLWGALPLALGPQGLGQRRTVTNGVATSMQGGAIRTRPRSRGSREHGAQREKPGCVPHGLWSEWEPLAADLSWRPWEASPCSNHGSRG